MVLSQEDFKVAHAEMVEDVDVEKPQTQPIEIVVPEAESSALRRKVSALTSSSAFQN
jgi:hypothetical protein